MFKIYKSEEPERALRLNRRALLQVLRVNGVTVARTWVGDLVDGVEEGKKVGEGEGKGGVGVSESTEAGAKGKDVKVEKDKGPEDGIHDDRAIFDRSGHGAVDAWRWIDIVGMGDAEATVENVHGKDDVERAVETSDKAAEVREPEMASVIEPHATEGITVESH